MAAKTLKEFDNLHRRDFDNGAILDEIRGVYKQRDDLLAALVLAEACAALAAAQGGEGSNGEM